MDQHRNTPVPPAPGHGVRTPRTVEYSRNRAADGAPLGLDKPIEELTKAEIEAIGKRHNIWTRAKMRRFLEALAQTCSVTEAAKSVGMSRQSAYRLRTRLLESPFDHAWEAALEFGMQQLAHAALDRAINGVEEPVFQRGEQVGTRTRFDERLTIFLLSNPGRVGRNAVLRDYISRKWEETLNNVEHGDLRWDMDREIPDTPEFAEIRRKAERFVREATHYPPAHYPSADACAAASGGPLPGSHAPFLPPQNSGPTNWEE